MYDVDGVAVNADMGDRDDMLMFPGGCARLVAIFSGGVITFLTPTTVKSNVDRVQDNVSHNII